MYINDMAKDRVLRYYNSGFGVSSIAILTGLSRTSIYIIINEDKIVPGTVKVKYDRLACSVCDAIFKYHAEGMNGRTIASKLDISDSTVYGYLHAKELLDYIDVDDIKPIIYENITSAAKMLYTKYKEPLDKLQRALTIYRILNNITLDDIYDYKYANIKKLLVQGLDIITICERLNVSRDSVYYVYNKFKDELEKENNIELSLISYHDIERAYKCNDIRNNYIYYKKHDIPLNELEGRYDMQYSNILNHLYHTGYRTR